MSREKKKRTAKSFLGRKYGKNAFKTGSKKDAITPGSKPPSKPAKPRAAKKARPKSAYQKYLEANPELKAQQSRTVPAPKAAPQPAAAPEQRVLSAEEQALRAIDRDAELRAIEARLERGEPLSPQEERYLEQKQYERQQLLDRLEADENADEEQSLFDQFEKGRFF